MPGRMKVKRRISKPVRLAQEERKEVGREENMPRCMKVEKRAS